MIKRESVDITDIEYQVALCPQCGLPMKEPHPLDAPEIYGCPNCHVLERAPYDNGVSYPRVKIVLTNGIQVYLPAREW